VYHKIDSVTTMAWSIMWPGFQCA